jgi:hypothetical protein
MVVTKPFWFLIYKFTDFFLTGSKNKVLEKDIFDLKNLKRKL